ncbi:cytochrome P450 [Arthrobacter sunyaminii]|uniref:Cytochrome P450 n=1 Tax=Arthrobacter sunyaminii TaxID=2816859 RepID=A0A975S699_9MICC|nr:cytochrome P450 [Arthrobacter sunyaminii]MBO0909822.1 cytochrome P450 [Arthrobacter sunyaminii]QWQ36612.1 cytochrome P450 [Arthrobacter sunyaminii]
MTNSFSTQRIDPYTPPAEHLRLQAENPVAQVAWGDGKIWAITKHADVRAMLSDARFSSDRSLPGHPTGRAYVPGSLRQLIEMDPPEHTTARSRIMNEFTVKKIAAMRPRITEIVDETIEAMLAGPSEVDLVDALSLPVPSMVIAELLGVPYEDHSFFQENSAVFVEIDATAEEKAVAIGNLKAYIGKLVAERVDQPGEDILSRQLAAGANPEELTAMGFLLLIAGHETTANMISLSVMTLLDKPELAQQLRDNPSLMPGAVEELLRYFTIAEIGGLRLATEDLEIDGTIIPAGDSVFGLTNTANRDPEVFEDPNRIDFTRGARNHLAFGFGPHQCLGQNLARLELEVVLAAVLRRLPTLRLAVPREQASFKEFGPNYGVYSLPVAW